MNILLPRGKAYKALTEDLQLNQADQVLSRNCRTWFSENKRERESERENTLISERVFAKIH